MLSGNGSALHIIASHRADDSIVNYIIIIGLIGDSKGKRIIGWAIAYGVVYLRGMAKIIALMVEE